MLNAPFVVLLAILLVILRKLFCVYSNLKF